MRPYALALIGMFASACAGAPARTPTRPALPANPTRQGLSSYADAIRSIAAAIERLKPEYPQLAGFSAARNANVDRLTITYDHHTHRARHRGGWTSGVPNPDDDGLWFHLDFHDPSSTAQIHTQPVVPELRYREKRVMFLILEGKATRPVAPALNRILGEHGAHPPAGRGADQ